VKKLFSRNVYFICLPLFLAVFLNCCDVFGTGGSPLSYPIKFSIKNETSHALSAVLTVGEIPCVNARYDELSLIPDEVYKLVNERWSSDYGSSCLINPGTYDRVYTMMPIMNLKSYVGGEKYDILYESMANKYFSFVFTISRGEDIVYRVAGWDVPEEDMVKYRIDDKMYGYYHTAEEDYIGYSGGTWYYPRLTSKLFPGDFETGFITSLTYYIKATSSGISLLEFNQMSLYVRDSDYWETH